MILMTCCNSRYATVRDSMNHECPTEEITFTPSGAGHAVVSQNGTAIGDAHRQHGFIHYRSRDLNTEAVIKSTDSTFFALARALKNGIENGRDDRA